MNGSNIIVLILMIIAALAILSVAAGENFCNCAGLGWKTPKPTYYVYRPTGDVSNYQEVPGQFMGQFMTIGSQPVIYPEQNLGWRTGMPYDYFEEHIKSNNWAAGADPNPAVNSSVPLLATQNLTVSPSNNGGYMKNYGSPCGANANNMVAMAPFAEGLKYPDGSPHYEGPAGSFSSKACPSANAYNLGVGVL